MLWKLLLLVIFRFGEKSRRLFLGLIVERDGKSGRDWLRKNEGGAKPRGCAPPFS